jgi:hypothetical protein
VLDERGQAEPAEEHDRRHDDGEFQCEQQGLADLRVVQQA